MDCDFKNCLLWADGKCTDEEEREKCPLMKARLELRASDDAFRKLMEKFEVQHVED